MKLLLDTCTFLWLAAEPVRISAGAARALNNPANELLLSDVSVWEIVLKHGAGKLPLPGAPREWIPLQTAFFQIEGAGLTRGAIYRSGEFPGDHRDPFDRLLAGQCLESGFRLVTPDPAFDALGVRRVWG